MSRLSTVKTVASTVLFAGAVGFIVQYGETAPTIGDDEASASYNKPPHTLMLSKNAQGEAVFGMPPITSTPADHAANVHEVLAVDVVYKELAVPRLGPILATPVIGCDTSVSAKRRPGAMVALTVSAPCFEDAEFAVQHEGMIFSATTDDDGAAEVLVPALMPNAMFEIAFDNIVQANTGIFVPELRQYDRVVLQWVGSENIRIHALEDGAQIGDPGHVWSASVHTPEDLQNGVHGFVVYLGSDETEMAYQAEVYTYHAGKMDRGGQVDLRVGVTVTDDNCAREVDATTMQTRGGQPPISARVAIPMPDCSQVGEVVLLRDKFADLALATN